MNRNTIAELVIVLGSHIQESAWSGAVPGINGGFQAYGLLTLQWSIATILDAIYMQYAYTTKVCLHVYSTHVFNSTYGINCEKLDAPLTYITSHFATLMMVFGQI